MIANFAFLVLLSTLTLGLDGPKSCSKNKSCREIRPDDYKKGIFTTCTKINSSDSKSGKACAVIYVINSDFNYTEVARVPSDPYCEPLYSDEGMRMCLELMQTNSSFQGKYQGRAFETCYASVTAYLCSTCAKRSRKYVTCSVQGVKCSPAE